MKNDLYLLLSVSKNDSVLGAVLLLDPLDEDLLVAKLFRKRLHLFC